MALPTWRRVRFSAVLLGLVLVGVIAWYDLTVRDGYTIGTWLARPLDWLFIASNVILLGYVVVPVVAARERATEVWMRFRRRPTAVLGLGWLVAAYLLGTFGFVVAPGLELDFLHANQPPLFGSISAEHVSQCAGEITNGRCHGSLRFPLGTDLNGYRLELLLLHGLHVSVYVAAISLSFILPIALVVGVGAGYLGGWVDRAVMRLVEVQDAVPPLVIYFLFIFLFNEGLLLILILFGFLGWEGTARVVRSEARRLASADFVVATRALGGERSYILRKHVAPAVSSVAVPVASQQAPVLLLTEAGIAFLGLEAFDLQSFGNIIARGTVRGDVPMLAKWWVSGFAVATLALTVLSFKTVGDGLVVALDPRSR